LPSYATCIFIRQPAPLGLGHAVLCAEAAVGKEPFFVHLADDLIIGEEACLKQMGSAFDYHRGSILGVEEVPRSDTDKYGIVEVENIHSQVSRITGIVEKPKPSEARSNLAVVGRYVLTPRLFDDLRRIGQGAGGEIQLTDGIARLMSHEAVYADRFVGKRYDCGSKLGYLQATVEQALRHPELRKDFRSYLLHLTRQLTKPPKAQSKDKSKAKAKAKGNAKGKAQSGASGKPAKASKARKPR
jgi:UTP--glucose-1-phosphate uridylyltransferase